MKMPRPALAAACAAAAALASSHALADYTVNSGQTVVLNAANPAIITDVLYNNGTIRGENIFGDLTASGKIVNAGTIEGVSAQLRMNTATVTNNGLIKSTGPGAAVYVNGSGLALQTISGTGSFDVGNGFNAGGRYAITANDLLVRPDTAFTAGVNASGSTLSVNRLLGGGVGPDYGIKYFAMPANSTLTIRDGGGATFASDISGGAHLIKDGGGTQTLAGSNTYTGGTEVNAGTLRFTDPDAGVGYGLVVTNANGTLEGSGRIAAFNRTYGTLGVGQVGQAATLDTFGLRLYSGSTLKVDLGDAAHSDLLHAENGDLLIDNVTLNVAAATGLTVGQTVYFLTWSQILFANPQGNLDQTNVPLASDFHVVTAAGVSGTVIVENTYDGNLNVGRVGFTVTAVPEPTTLAALAGVGAIALRRRR